jgi:hypothetical protein
MLSNTEKTKAIAAAKAGMDEKTARKYLKSGILPGQSKKERNWRTRQNPFEAQWPAIKERLTLNPGLEAKTLFEALQREQPGTFSDGQLRCLQRQIKVWRATEGPAKEVFFPQVHYPGQLCASDFTDMTHLNVTINGQAFKHLVYHFVLTYSNWETGTICFSESYESLSEGLQNALWKLGGVPHRHRTDQLSAAVNNACNPEVFTRRYQELLDHYKLQGEKIQVAQAHENGDIEQRHYRFKKAVDQSLFLRGYRDFPTREEYETFVQKLFMQLNSGRKERFKEELKIFKPLPDRRMNDCRKEKLKVGPSSTIRLRHNTYSVHSRLIGEYIEARIYSQQIEIWYAQRKIDVLPRLKGEQKSKIQYRHIIDWLVRKPGAFEHYRYRHELFPSTNFRMAYDALKAIHTQQVASSQYLKILQLAARESETRVDAILRELLAAEQPILFDRVEEQLCSEEVATVVKDIKILEVDLFAYDTLFDCFSKEVAHG